MKKLFKLSILLPIVISFAANLSIVSAFEMPPQMKSSEVINRMKEALDKFIGAEITFKFTAFSSEGDTVAKDAGFFAVQGDAFKMKSSNFSIYCNANAKWIHDIENNEITIFSYDPATIDFLDNPFAALKNMNSADFKIPLQSEMIKGFGDKSYRLMIFSKDKKSEFVKIAIYVNAETFLPSLIDYESKNGERYNIDIISIVGVPERGILFFTPDKEILEDPDVYITDMR